MLNLTARLAIKLRYLPDWDVDWSDNTPQRSRESLTLEEFLPNEEDATSFTERAVQYTMCFLVKEFHSLHDLRPFLPEVTPLHSSRPKLFHRKFCLRMRSILMRRSGSFHS